MDQNYIDLLKRERETLIRDHTRVVTQGYSILAPERWRAVKRLTRAIAKAERTSRWWD